VHAEPQLVPSVAVEAPVTPSTRVASVDAYRGLVMFLMLAEVLRSCAVAAALPASLIWRVICYEQTHAAWVGASLHDLIQPSFYFVVGISLGFSLSRRRLIDQSVASMTRHMLIRSLVLIVLGMAMVAVHPRQWSWVFTDTLTQIGLAYPFLFVIALRPKREWYVALALILIGYWLWFALSPIPPANFDYASVGVSADWLQAHGLGRFAAHWQKNSNVAWQFDHWFLNLFPRRNAFTGDVGGLTTLNFVPSIGTMILGLIAGDQLRRPLPSARKMCWLGLWGLVLIAAGWALGAVGVCPVVKAIWTSSWVLFSGGWCFWLLAAFYAVIDVGGFRRWAFPLIVIGLNSIVAYVMSHVYPSIAFNAWRRAFGTAIFDLLGTAYEPFVYGAAVFAMYWLILYILYRQGIIVRI
jgi:heparan-alpha-glucosaminide N-acetyltransferase